MNQPSNTNDTPTVCGTSDLKPRQDAPSQSSVSTHASEDAHPNSLHTCNPNTQSQVAVRLWHKPLNKVFALSILALIFLHFCALTTTVGIYFWYELKGEELQSVTAAGQVLRAEQTTSMFSHGTVETDKGFFFLENPMSVTKAEALTLELRGNGMRHLCDSQHHCTPLVHTF
jgi:hypothetical protein